MIAWLNCIAVPAIRSYTFPMASLHTADPTPRFLDAEELLAIRGTPDFDTELRRQMLYLVEQDRKVKLENRLPVAKWITIYIVGVVFMLDVFIKLRWM